jgi:hypothetical protein
MVLVVLKGQFWWAARFNALAAAKLLSEARSTLQRLKVAIISIGDFQVCPVW